MSNEQTISNNIDNSEPGLEPFSKDNTIGDGNGKSKAKQNKPKRRKVTSSESGGVGHNAAVPKSGEVGSSVQQARQRRTRRNKLEEELPAFCAGLVTDGLTDARSKVGSLKPRRDRVRKLIRAEESELSDEEDPIEEEQIEDLINQFLPFFSPPVNPMDSVLSKVVSAFAGYPVISHVTQTKPNTSKLTIEVEI